MPSTLLERKDQIAAFGRGTVQLPIVWCRFSLVGACVTACLVYLWLPASMADPDIWWHLRNAEYLVTGHHFLRHDLYSFTAAGAPWINHEWLAELPFYAGWTILGSRGVYFVTLLVTEFILLGVFHLAYGRSGSTVVAMLGSAVATTLATVSFGPRTLLFGWLCLIAELLVLERSLREDRLLWLLPGLFALWINLHGSWMIGLVFLIIFALCAHLPLVSSSIDPIKWDTRGLRRLRICVALSVAALLINPYGLRLVLYPFDMAFQQKLNIGNVDEWKTLDFHAVRGKVLLALLAVMFGAQILRRRRWRLHELAFVAVATYSACTYSRFTFLAAIVIIPIVAGQLRFEEVPSPRTERPWVNFGMIFAILLLIARGPNKLAVEDGETMYPVQAIVMLKSFRPQGRVFNDYLWGGFLEWNARHVPVFIDSRVDIFERNGSFRDYLDVLEMRRPLEVLDAYDIRYVLFERNTPLSYLLAHTPGWKTDYADATTILFERSQP